MDEILEKIEAIAGKGQTVGKIVFGVEAMSEVKLQSRLPVSNLLGVPFEESFMVDAREYLILDHEGETVGSGVL